jgi:hypothetical protein
MVNSIIEGVIFSELQFRLGYPKCRKPGTMDAGLSFFHERELLVSALNGYGHVKLRTRAAI